MAPTKAKRHSAVAHSLLPEPFTTWFAARGWSPRAHQLALLEKAATRRSTLLIAPTGSGKTLAGFLPSLVDLATTRANRRGCATARPNQSTNVLHTLYVSPLKALAADVARNLVTPVDEMGLKIRIETRSGDTTAARRQRGP